MTRDVHDIRAIDAAATAPVIDEDLYCLDCAYNLRGLVGDVVRCPECGAQNSADALHIPAEQVNRKLRELETSIAASVFFLVLLCMLLLLAIAEPRIARLGGFLGSAIGAIVLAVAAVLRFRWTCDRQRGWQRVLAEYWLTAFLLHGLLIVPLIIITLVRIRTRSGNLLYLVYLAFVFVAYLLARPLHRRLRRLMDPLQRDVALKVLQQEQRRQQRWRMEVLAGDPYFRQSGG